MSLNALLHEEPCHEAHRSGFQDRTDRKLTDKRSAKPCEHADNHRGPARRTSTPIIDKERHARPRQPPARWCCNRARNAAAPAPTTRPRELTEPIVREALAPVLRAPSSRRRTQPPRAEQILDLKVCDPAMGSGAFLVEACRQLGKAVVAGMARPRRSCRTSPPTKTTIIYAQPPGCAQRCLYGVDRNPAAVDLAKLSLWLTTLAKDHPLTFLNHALRHGDSLVGLSKRQIEAFHWKERTPQMGIERGLIQDRLANVSKLREQIRAADDETPDFELRRLWDDAKHEAGVVALLGDMTLAAFFEGKTAKEREKHRDRLAGAVLKGEAAEYRGVLDARAPFHWEIEFPEVFDRDKPGFDALVGNPPFAGKNTMRSAHPDGYPEWLKALHEESHGNSDLVAHFFRRSFNLLRQGGTFGLIATNTIAQGDTRNTGLKWICERGGHIYRVRRRFNWPGQAAVVVSVLHLHRGDWQGPRWLDGRRVENITAFLFHRGGHRDPARLRANEKQSFIGSYVLGMGFTFDDTDKKGVATPLAEMRRLIQESPQNQEVIFPYIGGEEVNTSPIHEHHRYVINFHNWPHRRKNLGAVWQEADVETRRTWLRDGTVPLDYPGPVAEDWPELLDIVEERVKPARAHLTTNAIGRKRAHFWWRYGSAASELYASIDGLDRVLLIPQTSNVQALAFAPADQVFGHTLIVLTLAAYADFCALQSRFHQIWSAFLGPTMKDDLRYTPSDCFETFPFPRAWRTNPTLEAAGKTYYDYRAALMVKNNEGLTKTYNRFHDPNETSPEIAKLRDLHTAMDQAVLAAYGWQDIPTDCEFLLDYPIDEAEWGKKKKPYRYRWPDETRDEVLARLLELNAKRTPQ